MVLADPAAILAAETIHSARPNALSFSLDLFGILVVDAHSIIVGTIGGFQKFIELRVDSLGVPVFSTLDDQSHAPSGERGERVPFQAIADRNSSEAIQGKDCESRRARGEHA